MDFAKWLNDTFPPDPRTPDFMQRAFSDESRSLMLSLWGRKSYCAEITSGPHVVRPFNLGWRSDFGLAYICEPEELMYLCQLILSSGSLAMVPNFNDKLAFKSL